MKFNILILILLSLVFNGCNNAQKTADKKQVLSVTIEPQKFFLEQLVGDKYTVNSLIPAGANPETFDPVPSQLVSVSRSKAFFMIGSLGVENTLVEKIKDNNPDVLFISCSDGIKLIEDDAHHNCDTASPHHGGDPHIWSSPSTAKVIIQNMYDSLIAFDKENQDYYKEKYDKLVSIIDSTDFVIKGHLEKVSHKDFIIYHPALTYYAQEYGLKQHVIEQDGKNPTPRQLANLIDTAKDKHIKIVFMQQEYDMKNAETIAKAIDAKMVPINLLNYNWSEEMIDIAKAFTYE